MQIKYDDIDPPGIYIKITDEPVWKIRYINEENGWNKVQTVHISYDKNGKICGLHFIFGDQLDGNHRNAFKGLNEI